MKKFILKTGLYTILIILGLEILVRIFHFHKERPERYLDEYNVEKWVPNQSGVWVIGNRKMHSMEYHINNFGFNSIYDEFQPSFDDKEIALVGDSFIQGFHQDIYDSLGQKLETQLNEEYKVLEFGYAGWDFADQLHLLKAYQHLFDKIEHIIVYMRFTDDLDRNSYEVSNRFSLNTPLNRILKQIKTVVYLRDIGLMDPITNFVDGVKKVMNGKSFIKEKELVDKNKLDQIKFENFKHLVETYEYDKNKNILLLDYSLCPPQFLNYMKKNGFQTIDFSEEFKASSTPPTYIFDQHWNNQGRNIIANLISNYIQKQ